MKKITEFMAPELGRVDGILRESLDSESDLIREVGEYICFTKGKKLRPMLTLLMSRVKGLSEPPVEVAASIELIQLGVGTSCRNGTASSLAAGALGPPSRFAEASAAAAAAPVPAPSAPSSPRLTHLWVPLRVPQSEPSVVPT